MTSQSVCVGSIVHLVVAEGGQRCRAALVTAMADPTDAYRDPDIIGLRAWTDTDTIVLPLPLGGAPHDPGEGRDDTSCDGLSHSTGTWHHIGMVQRGGPDG